MTDQPPADRLRVVTLNIFCQHDPWQQRRDILVDGFRELGADVIALQEVITHDGYDQARDILGDGYHIAHQTRGKIDDAGVAIASRWPIRTVDEPDLHVTTRAEGTETFALIVEIEAPEPFGQVICATYPSEYRPGFELERERQAVALARVLQGRVVEEKPHIIVAGDMNADLDAASMRFWTGRQSLDGESVCYRDAWESVKAGVPGPTFTPENGLMGEANWDWPFRQIDHILVRCSTHGLPTLLPNACERTFTETVQGTWGSDHFGVMADLAIPPQ